MTSLLHAVINRAIRPRMSTISIQQKPVTPRIRELTQAEMPSIWPIIGGHNKWMSEGQFHDFLGEMLPQGYRAIGAFVGDKLVGCCGFWIRTRFWCGKQFDLDNFIIAPDHRSGGLGKRMLSWLEEKAKEEGCQLMVLDTYVTYARAQKFYMDHGFAMTGFHMTKIPGSTEIGKLPFSEL